MFWAGLSGLALAAATARALPVDSQTPREPVEAPAMAGPGGPLPGFWRAIRPYGSERPQQPVPVAIREFDQLLRTISAAQTAFSWPMVNGSTFHSLRERIAATPSRELWHLEHPLLTPAPEKLVIDFGGYWKDLSQEGFRLTAGAPPREASGFLPGQLRGRLAIAPGSLSEESAIIRASGQLNLGSLRFQELMQSWEQFHREIETAAGSESGSAGPASAGSVLGRTAADEALEDKIAGSAPRLLETLEPLVRFDDWVDPPFRHSGAHYTRLRVSHRFDPDYLQERWPGSWEVWAPLFRYVYLDMEIRSRQGHRLGHVGWRADQDRLTIDMTFAGGGIVPTDRIGNPVGETVHPARLPELDFTVDNTLMVSFYGLRVYLDRLDLAARFQRQPGKPDTTASLGLNLREPPRVRVEGALLHVLPPWLIDVLIPGTLESRISEAFHEAVNGRGGQGLKLEMAFSETARQDQLLQLAVETEAPWPLAQQLLAGLDKDEEPGSWWNPFADGEPQPRLLASLARALRKDFDAMREGLSGQATAWLRQVSP